MTKKAEFRAHFERKRNELRPEICQLFSLKICKLAETLNFKGIKTLHIYQSISEKKEVNTQFIIDWLQKMHPHIRLVIPKTHPDQTLTHYLYNENLRTQLSKWGINEPIFGDLVSEDVIDMVFVPLLCADKQGNRLGYGKGYYDRFLAKCRPDVKIIGLSFFDLQDSIPFDMFDFRLKQCITPERIINFNLFE